MRSYIKVRFDHYGEAFQEVIDGQVVAYRSPEGEALEGFPPVGEGCAAIDPDPDPLPWMVFDA